MAHSRIPGPIGFDPHGLPAGPGGNARGPGSRGRELPGPLGGTLWQKQSADATPAPAPAPKAKPRALIVIGNGHDGIKQGVRRKGDQWFDQAALGSFAAYTASHDVRLVHVASADAMKKLISAGPWDLVIYFGHGVENQMALAPNETGRPLSAADLAAALASGGAKKVYLFGCKAGLTGLARQLSRDVKGATVFGTFGSLDVDWEQRMDPDGTFTNRFVFKEALSEYTGGYQTQNGKKLPKRRHEMRDPIKLNDNPTEEMMVDQ